ncbi:MAG: aerobic carbon-monoxide dehydrogenase large subunit, partial [Actinomycetota bacterium]
MTAATESTVQGAIGQSPKRVEDDRFIRGRGSYVDDVQLPGMLFMAIYRSPFAHATINSIDCSRALAMPGVLACITGKDLEAHGLAWMPTLAGDTQAVLATDKVRFQGQEVVCVIAKTQYQAEDALEGIDVDYDPLPVIVDPKKAMYAHAPIIRSDLEGKADNHIFTWESGDADATDRVFQEADVVVKLDTLYPRIHPAPMETCGCVSDYNTATGKMTVHLTSQAPHAHRTLFALVAGLPEQKIRIISPDVGGGFGNKVPIYPGYVVATAASLLIGKPAKWIESRSENLISTGFARDYHMSGEIAATKDGQMLALRANVLADHGAFNAQAQPSKWPAGFFNIATGSYDFQAAYCKVDGVYTNKAPGGIAYRCSFRVTEAAYLIERLVENLALETGIDAAEIRRRNFIKPDQVPYRSPMGWEYDSGDYEKALDIALDLVGYDELRTEQAAKRERGEIMGIGFSSFTEIVGAGMSKICDIAGLAMIDSAELRIHPTGKGVLKLGVQSQGQGHETTFAQIVANELGLPSEDIAVEHGDTDHTPYGLGTYASRSTPTGGAATAIVARKLREKARQIAAHLLECAPDDLEFDSGTFSVKGSPDRVKTVQECIFAAYQAGLPDGMENGFEDVTYYDAPEMTYPFGTYICVVDVDKGTGEVKVRKFVAVDDCGTRINPMIVDGQIHGGLTEGYAVAMGQQMPFDAQGNLLGNTLMDYFLPTAVETPKWETDHTVTPSPHHPIGAKGVAE